MGADRIVVALDVPDLDQAVGLASSLSGHVGWFKVGLELFSGHGPDAVHAIAQHGRIFLDLKLHDIPTTVARATARLSALPVDLLTVHAAGGAAMVAAAVEGLGDRGRILAVTVLTSMTDDDAVAVGVEWARRQVPRLAALAVRAGAPGLVCAAPDLRTVQAMVGPDTLLVAPGIRPAGSSADDQARVGTPASAVADGADLVVIGRPITRAEDPVEAADTIAASLA